MRNNYSMNLQQRVHLYKVSDDEIFFEINKTQIIIISHCNNPLNLFNTIK